MVSHPEFTDPIGSGAGARDERWLVVRVAGLVAAVPAARVVETCRPLRVTALPDLPPEILGTTVVRGRPVPVLDLGRLLDPAAHGAPGRFVIARSGSCTVALAVNAVLEVARLDTDAVSNLPPLLSGAAHEAVAGLGRRDAEVLHLLDAFRALPGDLEVRLVHGAEG